MQNWNQEQLKIKSSLHFTEVQLLILVPYMLKLTKTR